MYGAGSPSRFWIPSGGFGDFREPGGFHPPARNNRATRAGCMPAERMVANGARMSSPPRGAGPPGGGRAPNGTAGGAAGGRRGLRCVDAHALLRDRPGVEPDEVRASYAASGASGYHGRSGRRAPRGNEADASRCRPLTREPLGPGRSRLRVFSPAGSGPRSARGGGGRLARGAGAGRAAVDFAVGALPVARLEHGRLPREIAEGGGPPAVVAASRPRAYLAPAAVDLVPVVAVLHRRALRRQRAHSVPHRFSSTDARCSSVTRRPSVNTS